MRNKSRLAAIFFNCRANLSRFDAGKNLASFSREEIQVPSPQHTNWPFAASGHMVHAGGQAARWDIQNKENSNLICGYCY